MTILQEQYLTDRDGKRVGVVLDLDQFATILEELEDIRAYDAAKAAGDEAVPV